eukprot:1288488-Rhodomonas_salina.1
MRIVFDLDQLRGTSRAGTAADGGCGLVWLCYLGLIVLVGSVVSDCGGWCQPARECILQRRRIASSSEERRTVARHVTTGHGLVHSSVQLILSLGGSVSCRLGVECPSRRVGSQS